MWRCYRRGFHCANLEKPLLGRKAGIALRLIQKVNEINEVNKVNKVDDVTEKVTTSVEYKQLESTRNFLQGKVNFQESTT